MQIALRALREVLLEKGKTPMPIPVGAKVVSNYRTGISGADTTPDARLMAFKRAYNELLGLARIGVGDGQVWLAGEPDTRAGQPTPLKGCVRVCPPEHVLTCPDKVRY
jgi:hypothetical protein